MKTIEDIPQWQNQRALVRVDFNVPLDGERITDQTRIEATLPTIRYLVERGARVILMSHLGRPKGQVNEKYRLNPIAHYLKQALPRVPVHKVDEVVSPSVTAAVEDLQPGAILLLENVRFHPGEETNDPAFSKELASLADIYVNDAFGAAHRAHASTEGVTHHVGQKVAGLLMAKEVTALSSLLANPSRPFTAIIGGSKVSSKISILRNLIPHVDNIVIGGAMIFTFHKANGLNVGKSLVEEDHLETARQLQKEADEQNTCITLVRSIVAASAFDNDAQTQVLNVEEIPDDWMGLDISPTGSERVVQLIQNSKTVLWNGPLGVFEMPNFAHGTRTVADALASWTDGHHCKSILGGGDTLAAIQTFGIDASRYTHVSTGGGANLEFLEGRNLPGIHALDPKEAMAL